MARVLPPGARAAARRAVSTRLPYTVIAEREYLAANGPRRLVAWNAMLTDAWLRDRWSRRLYRQLDEAALRARRTSSKVFVFGSGYSLNEVGRSEWDHFAEHDTFGFNAFFHQRWIRVGFHLLRGGIYGSLRWRPYAQDTAAAIAANPGFADTAFLLQGEYLGQFSNQLVGYGLLPRGAPVFRYRTVRGAGPPSRSFAEGLRHAVGTLDDTVNAARLLGWTEIVLVGVDLYDSRYFWLPPDKTEVVDPTSGHFGPGDRNPFRGQRYDEPHNTARSGVVALMEDWSGIFAREGVHLSVYNPRSLLADVLPVYEP